MKNISTILIVTISLVLVSCAALFAPADVAERLQASSKADGRSSSSAGNLPVTFGLYTETGAHKTAGSIETGITTWMTGASNNTVDLTWIYGGTYEGDFSCRVTIMYGGWFGCGAFTIPSVDLSAYSNGTLVAAFRSLDGSAFRIGMRSSGVYESWVKTSSYGFIANGSWRIVRIPVPDLLAANPNLDLTQIDYYFMLSQDGTPHVGDVFYFDDVYLERGY